MIKVLFEKEAARLLSGTQQQKLAPLDFPRTRISYPGHLKVYCMRGCDNDIEQAA